MNQKIVKFRNNLLDPFWAFFSIVGIGNYIILPLSVVSFRPREETLFWLYTIFWSLALLASLSLAVMYIKKNIKGRISKLFGYGLILVICLGLMIAPYLNIDRRSLPKVLVPKYIREYINQ